jgi:hypothetical protein
MGEGVAGGGTGIEPAGGTGIEPVASAAWRHPGEGAVEPASLGSLRALQM